MEMPYCNIPGMQSVCKAVISIQQYRPAALLSKLNG